MKLSTAIKKLSRYANVEQKGREFFAVINNQVVSFCANEEEDPSVLYFHVREIEDETNIDLDYFPGAFFDNLTQALRFVGVAR